MDEDEVEREAGEMEEIGYNDIALESDGKESWEGREESSEALVGRKSEGR